MMDADEIDEQLDRAAKLRRKHRGTGNTHGVGGGRKGKQSPIICPLCGVEVCHDLPRHYRRGKCPEA